MMRVAQVSSPKAETTGKTLRSESDMGVEIPKSHRESQEDVKLNEKVEAATQGESGTSSHATAAATELKEDSSDTVPGHV